MISPESASGELTVITSAAADIEPVFEAMIESPLPGFQIGPEVTIDESLLILHVLMRRYDPDFSFNDISERTNPGVIARPHFDERYVQRMAGIAIHENRAGEGEVALQLLDTSITKDIDVYADGAFVGPCLRGETRPGMKTVFSERIYSPGRGVILGATYHYFGTRGDTRRNWIRHTFAGHG